MENVWVGLLHVRSLDATGGAYVYCGGRAESVAGVVGAVSDAVGEREHELVAIEWLSPHSELAAEQQASETISEVFAALAGDDVALGTFFTYPEDDEADPAEELKQRVEGFVEGWIEGAVEQLRPFELGDFAFVAELRFAAETPGGQPETDIGWAYDGSLERAPALFARAAEDAAEPNV
jgi:hypothetical protein